MLIRKATVADIPALERLIPESARGLSVDYYTAEQIEGAIARVFGVDSQLIADETYFVAEVHGAIVGCGGWSKRKTLYGGDQMKAPGEDPLLDPQTDPARIRAFFIHPTWARRGIGGQIIGVCEQAAREAGFRAIEIIATLPGEPLYARFGYEATERFDIPLADGIALPLTRMRKAIVLQK